MGGRSPNGTTLEPVEDLRPSSSAEPLREVSILVAGSLSCNSGYGLPSAPVLVRISAATENRGACMITISNKKHYRQDIAHTNYWDSEYARNGHLFLSVSSGAFRLLVPHSHCGEIERLRSCERLIVSRGPWPGQGRRLGLELFCQYEDGLPHAIHLGAEQVDIIPGHDAKADLTFSAWTAGPNKELERECCFRWVKEIPCLEPWR